MNCHHFYLSVCLSSNNQWLIDPTTGKYRVYAYFDVCMIFWSKSSVTIYRNSSKCRRGEILFQSPVWCGDNSRAARFEGGVYRDRYACTYTAPIISLLYVHVRIMRMRMRINVVDPLPCGEISRTAFIGMSWQKRVATFRGWRDFEEIRYIETLLALIRSCI